MEWYPSISRYKLDLTDRLCYKCSYNHYLDVSLDLRYLYCLDLLLDLSQSLTLNILQEKDYMSLISIADRVDLVLFCFSLHCRSNANNIGLIKTASRPLMILMID